MKRVSILGTGWLGFSLAKSLKENFEVKVSIRNENKKEQMINEGFSPYLLDEDSFENLDKLLKSDYVFINFPPSKSNDYIKFLDNIFSHKDISYSKKLIFISSTSIYPNEEKIFNEDCNIKNPVSKIVFQAENLVKDKTDVIFRCAGLMGEDRVAGKYFVGKVLDSEDIKVNYVHKEDVIKAIYFVIENDIKGVFNLCSKEHPTRKEVYLNNANKYGFTKPIFENKKEYKNRIIDGSKIESFGFEYKYPNPLKY